MHTFTADLANQALPAIATVASTTLLALLGIGFKWLVDHAKSQRVKDILGRVQDASTAAVRDVSNTLVDDLRKNGVLSPEARAKLRAEAVAKIQATLGQVTVDKLRSTLGFANDAELIAFLNTQVESSVWVMKLQQVAAAAAPPAVPAAAKPPAA
jgi:capsule polysaccharide export protein KpsE/RkpR